MHKTIIMFLLAAHCTLPCHTTHLSYNTTNTSGMITVHGFGGRHIPHQEGNVKKSSNKVIPLCLCSYTHHTLFHVFHPTPTRIKSVHSSCVSVPSTLPRVFHLALFLSMCVLLFPRLFTHASAHSTSVQLSSSFSSLF